MFILKKLRRNLRLFLSIIFKFLIVYLASKPLYCLDVKVRLFSSQRLNQVSFYSRCFIIGNENIYGKITATIYDKRIRIIAEKKYYEGERFDIKPCNLEFEMSVGKTKRRYNGSILLYLKKSSIIVVNKVDIDDYVLSVTEYETSSMKNIEAIKANAVAARTYVLASINSRHVGEEYDFCDLTHCQLYKGISKIRDIVRDAFRDTHGYVILYKGKPAWTLYHSVCGGLTEDAFDIWGYDTMPYLVSVEDRINGVWLCSSGWGYRWRTKISIKRLQHVFSKANIINREERLKGILLSSVTKTGRVKNILIITDKKSYELRGIDFYHIIGRNLNWFAIKSTNFTVTYNKKYFIFEGKGYGHGTGMCQTGADKMAELGYSWRDIIEHYYKGVKIVKYY